MVPFAGWEMPVQYSGVSEEHRAVREAAGLFDVSHMGELVLGGEYAAQVVNYLITNDASRLADGQALYTCACNEHGTILDDLIVYRVAADRWLIVCNASNREKMAAHFKQAAEHHCDFEDASDRTAMIALQGPRALAVAALAGGDGPTLGELPAFHFRDVTLANVRCTVARTGYTGEDGVELFCAPEDAPQVWRTLIELGRPLGLLPCGLAARDTLRLEARLSLYGNDIDETTNPIEAGLSLGGQARQGRLRRSRGARPRQGRRPGPQARRLRDDGPRHRPARLPAARQVERARRRLHQRQPRPHGRQEHRPRLRARRDERHRDRAPGRLPRPPRRGQGRQDAVLQASLVVTRSREPRSGSAPPSGPSTTRQQGDMASDDVKDDRRYTKDHEWAKATAARSLVGITAFAVEQLGDITLVNLDVKAGDTLTAGKAFGTIESVKTLSDLFAPLSGKVARVNPALEDKPELVNEDCWEAAWMIGIAPSDASELDGLLDPSAYAELLKNASH